MKEHNPYVLVSAVQPPPPGASVQNCLSLPSCLSGSMEIAYTSKDTEDTSVCPLATCLLSYINITIY